MKNQIKDLSNFSDMELLNELEKRGHYVEDTPSHEFIRNRIQ